MGSWMIQSLRLRYVNKSDVVDFGIWLHTRPPQRLPSSTGRDSASGLARLGQALGLREFKLWSLGFRHC